MKERRKFASGRSRILWEVTFLVWFVFTLSSLLTAYFYADSTNNMIEKSKNKLVSSEAQNISSSFKFSNKLTTEAMITELSSVESMADVTNSIITKEPTGVQEKANAVLKGYVDDETMGIAYVIVILPSIPPTIPEPMVLFSSDEELMFDDVPASVQEVIDSGEDYGIAENGIPEWGLSDEQLIVITPSVDAYPGMEPEVFITGIKQIHEEIEAINNYYKEERSHINMIVWTVIGISTTALFVITFFVLRYLIRKRVTSPIEELSEAAEKVLDGDLDVQVPIKKNEEFAILKKAFNEMIKHIQDMLTRSVE